MLFQKLAEITAKNHSKRVFIEKYYIKNKKNIGIRFYLSTLFYCVPSTSSAEANLWPTWVILTFAF